MLKIACGIQYQGKNYCGWQKQSHSPSVQETLEKVLSQIADQEIQIFSAGRTDTGVHALKQVIHFEAKNNRAMDAWIRGTNSLLPADIKVVFVQEVAKDFHARFSAHSRRYQYLIDRHHFSQPLWHEITLWVPHALNIEKMKLAAKKLLGEHDFKVFRGPDCQAKTTIRTIEHLEIIEHEHLLAIDIQANGFLHNMVRNIVGALLTIGKEKNPLSLIEELLQTQERKHFDTVAAHGLCFIQANYPNHFDLPKTNMDFKPWIFSW